MRGRMGASPGYRMRETPSRDWTERAACIGQPVEIFHPSSSNGSHGGPPRKGAYELAKSFCRVCPVTRECLDYVLKTESSDARYGIWAGTTPGDRAAIWKAGL